MGGQTLSQAVETGQGTSPFDVLCLCPSTTPWVRLLYIPFILPPAPTPGAGARPRAHVGSVGGRKAARASLLQRAGSWVWETLGSGGRRGWWGEKTPLQGGQAANPWMLLLLGAVRAGLPSDVAEETMTPNCMASLGKRRSCCFSV